MLCLLSCEQSRINANYGSPKLVCDGIAVSPLRGAVVSDVIFACERTLCLFLD